MRIAFDAKRAYQNNTGLGNYSRLLIEWLAKGYPAREFYLVAPKVTNMFNISQMPNAHIIQPQGIYKNLRSIWRSSMVKQDLKKLEVDIYHGLSNEIPRGIDKTGIGSVVTIHDLIFERYPGQYSKVDTAIYRQKFSYAAKHADHVIAISEQTKQDLVTYYKTPEQKITVCYQCCSPAFQQQLPAEAITATRKKYRLPEKYYLYVGAIIERKNLLNICKAMVTNRHEQQVPLVVIGNGGAYLQKVKQYVQEQGIAADVIFLSEQEYAIKDPGFTNAVDFPAIYQGALAMIYPSLFEGFGIPILEAMWSRTPVITSNLSCMPETGGDAAYYIDPMNVADIAKAMAEVGSNELLRSDMIANGISQAARFTPERHAASVMAVYESL